MCLHMVRCKCRSILAWCVYTWSDVSIDPFWQDDVECECWAFLTWVFDVFLLWSDVSVGRAFLTWFLDVFLPWSNVSVGPFWHGSWMCSSHGYMWVLGMPLWHGGGCVPPIVRCKWWAGLFDWVIFKCWRRWRPTWRLVLQPTWKRVSIVELPMMSRIEREHQLIEIAEAMMMTTSWWSSDDP